MSTPPAAPAFPIAHIGAGLPFADVAGQVEGVMGRADAVALIQAPAGSGKTTLVPPLVWNAAARSGGGRVIVTQPRRVAARAAARRLQQLSRDAAPSLADTVGFTVRGESTAGPHTRIEFVTPGVLLRRLLADPGLDSVAAVVIDEVHERSLDSDLVLALALDARDLRGDLRLMALSATLDAPRIAAVLGDGTGASVPVIDSPAALFPVETRQRPFAGQRMTERGVSRDFLGHVATQTVEALSVRLPEAPDDDGGAGEADVLVFVPGAWEVREVAETCRRLLATTAATAAHAGVEVHELHGRIGPREQDAIVRGRGAGQARRIIVSTALAESSLTVPGVRIVVDSGLSREVRRDAARNMSGLVTVTTSKAGMAQRSGRAGRLGPGLAVRCFDDTVVAGARDFPQPQILQADLTDAALTMAAWGTPGGEGLRLPDAPPSSALRDATRSLRGLGAIDVDGRITDRGRTLVRVPADPRLARALLDGAPIVGTDRAASIVAALSLEVPLPPSGEPRAEGRVTSAQLTAERRRLTRLAATLPANAPVPGATPPHSAVLPGAASLPEAGAPPAPAHSPEAAGIIVALSYPERIARRVSDGVYALAGGSRAGLAPSHPASGPWIAVAQVQRASSREAAGTGAIIREAAPLTEELAQWCGAGLITDTIEVEFGDDGARARRVRALGAIELSRTPTRPDPDQAEQAILAGIRAAGFGIFSWSTEATQLRARLALLHRELGDPWPDVSDEALLARFEEIAAPEIAALAGARGAAPRAPASISMREVLQRILPWPEAVQLDTLAPERLAVPSGSHVRLEYPPLWDDPQARVRLGVKLQEMFGCEDSPRIVAGRVRVLCELLSPARRPLALTDDLASFWAGPYRQVRAEMRGRYPKHPWPEDPTRAVPTARTKAAATRGT
ncbi:MAG: ATP-dependent helicase HrpB [Dermabacter sp.]|nr:ATP-dependent helicase HrpB [Dermabacter sp.]